MSHSLYTCGHVYTVELNRSLKVCIASADGLCRRVTSVQWPLRACGKDRLEYCSKVCKVSKIKKRSSTNLHMGLRTYIFPLLELEIRRTNLTCLPYIFVSVFSTACTYAHICRTSPVNLTFFTASVRCRYQVSNQSHPHNHLHAYFHFVPHQIYLYAHFIYSRVCGFIHFNNIMYCKKVSFAILLYLYIRTKKQPSDWTVLLTNSYQVSKAVFVLIKDFASILNLLSSTTRMNLNLLPSLTK